MSIQDRPGTAAVRHSGGDRLIAMNAAHNAFRRDLARMARAATPANLRDPSRYAAIQNGWRIFTHQLHIHHTHEDRFLWPRMRARVVNSESAISMLDDMESEHGRIDPLLAAVHDGFQRPEAVDVGAVIDELAGQLSAHLAHEERDALPLIGEVISDQEWTQVVRDIRRATKLSSASEFLPWLTDGTTREQAKTIASILPPPARLVLRGVWKPKYDKVPHW